MQKFIVLIFIFSCYTTTNAQLKVGSKVHLEEMNLKPITTSELTTSKFVVLDFWATWCAPCIASFPHLDSIQTKYQQQVQIVALSDEKMQKVADFLNEKFYSFDFFIDIDKTVFKLFEIEGRPLTALLDASGTLLWVGSSNDLDYVLDVAINDKNLSEFNVNPNHLYSKYYNSSNNKTENSIYTYKISIGSNPNDYEARTQKGSMVDSAINISYKATPISEIIQDLVSVSDIQFSNLRPELDTILLDITAKSISNQITYSAESKKLIIDLQSIFNFKIIETHELVDVYTLTVIDSNKLFQNIEVIEGGGMVETKGEKIKILRLSLSELSNFCQKKLKVYTTYNGDNTSKFNLELDKFKTLDELNSQLTSKYGLKLLPTKSELTFIELR